MKDLTPRKIVEYLDEYIVGQQDAKGLSLSPCGIVGAAAGFLKRLPVK